MKSHKQSHLFLEHARWTRGALPVKAKGLACLLLSEEVFICPFGQFLLVITLLMHG